MDQQELIEYKGERRRDFEDKIRRNRTHVGHWLKYATWEESQHEYERWVTPSFMPKWLDSSF